MLQISTEGGTTRLPLRDGVVRVGRSADNDVVLGDEPAASRYHAELTVAGNVWTVRDCESRNGTYLNGERVASEVKVKVGDVVSVREKNADYTLFKLVLDATSGRAVPEWLTVEKDNLRGSVAAIPTREQIDTPVAERLIVELYSK